MFTIIKKKKILHSSSGIVSIPYNDRNSQSSTLFWYMYTVIGKDGNGGGG